MDRISYEQQFHGGGGSKGIPRPPKIAASGFFSHREVGFYLAMCMLMCISDQTLYKGQTE